MSALPAIVANDYAGPATSFLGLDPHGRLCMADGVVRDVAHEQRCPIRIAHHAHRLNPGQIYPDLLAGAELTSGGGGQLIEVDLCDALGTL